MTGSETTIELMEMRPEATALLASALDGNKSIALVESSKYRHNRSGLEADMAEGWEEV
jgi:hypothetical protein